MKTEAERFWEKVGPPTGPKGCREWQACKTPAGYGLFWFRGVQQGAHRVAWTLTNGPIPDGLWLDHFKCDNPPCVEPMHLRAVTPRENTLRSDGPSSINASKTHCLRDHPLSGDNLHMDPSGRRICRECKRLENTSDAARARKAEWWRKTHGKVVA